MQCKYCNLSVIILNYMFIFSAINISGEEIINLIEIIYLVCKNVLINHQPKIR